MFILNEPLIIIWWEIFLKLIGGVGGNLVVQYVYFLWHTRKGKFANYYIPTHYYYIQVIFSIRSLLLILSPLPFSNLNPWQIPWFVMPTSGIPGLHGWRISQGKRYEGLWQGGGGGEKFNGLCSRGRLLWWRIGWVWGTYVGGGN